MTVRCIKCKGRVKADDYVAFTLKNDSGFLTGCAYLCSTDCLNSIVEMGLKEVMGFEHIYDQLNNVLHVIQGKSKIILEYSTKTETNDGGLKVLRINQLHNVDRT